MSPTSELRIAMMFAALCMCTIAPQLSAQAISTLLGFSGPDGANSTAGLIQATDGSYYGTTSDGGANGDGSVFRITPGGVLTTLYSFCSASACADGTNPMGALIEARDGNLYGTTELGTVLRITLSGTLTTIGKTIGQLPLTGPVQGKDGNLYGTTVRGGPNTCTLRPGYRVSCGTVLKITTSGSVTTLASFDQAIGFAPSSSLIQASDGNFYGTTPDGGVNYPGFGTVYKVTPTGALSVLYCFDGTDGEKSFGSLVQGRDGNLYGKTSFGDGNPAYGGTVFKISLTGTLTTLHSFAGLDGSGAEAGLMQARDGNFYGTTSGFGSNNLGTVFRITPS